MWLQARWPLAIACVGIAALSLLVQQTQSANLNVDLQDTVATRSVFREGIVGKPQYFNPLLAAYNPVDEDITSLLFEGLVKQDGSTKVEPALAQSWAISADNRTYTFLLKPEVRWSDGIAFTSEDVAFTYDLIQDNDFTGLRSLQEFWQSVEITVIDRHTIAFTLSEPLPGFLSYTSTGILPKHLLGTISGDDLLTHAFNLQPIGTGPFVLAEASETRVRLLANPSYHGEKSYLTEIEFFFFADDQERIQALRNNQIDALGGANWTSPNLSQLYEEPDVQIHNLPLQRISLIYLNLRDSERLPFFQERAVRQALYQYLDRVRLATDLLNGQVIPIHSPILPTNWAFNPNQLGLDYDPIEATEALHESGWLDRDDDDILDKENVPFSFKLLVDQDPRKILLAEAIAKQWAAFQISVAIEVVNNLEGRLESGNYEAALVEIQLDSDPDLYAYWNQNQVDIGRNYGGWQDQSASQALRQGRLAESRDERLQYYYVFQNIFSDEVPAMLLFQPIYTYIIRDTMRDMNLSELSYPSARFNNIEDWTIRFP